MQLFVCIQKDYSALEALMLAFVEYGLPGATLLDGRGMGQAIGRDLALFANYIHLFPDAESDSYVLLSMMSDEQVALCFELAEKTCLAGRGVALSLPVSRFAYLGASAQAHAQQETSEEPTEPSKETTEPSES